MIESPRGMTIMEAYELYRNNKLFINRRYQRKLVWSQLEKKALIDSIMQQYPIPLILLATQGDKYEIIDGMQRLNSIFGFIENHFSVLIDDIEKYFNISDFTFAQTQVNKGIVVPKEQVEYLTQEQVSSFIQYPFPVTIFKTGSTDEINETFRRINSTGRKLSPQEVRQAGNTSKFSLLVREISSEIRGDASREELLLQDMPTISIDSKLSKHEYGVNAEDTFWCKHGVLNVSDLKESEDEQVIADIILSCALGEPFPASRVAFDNYYGSGNDDKSNDIDVKINALGAENIRADILTVYSEIINLVDFHFGDDRLKKVLNPNAGGNPVKEAFYTVFMAFYELMIGANKVPHNYLKIKESVNNLHAKLVRSRNYTTTKDRRNNINICKGLIQDHFKKSNSNFRSATSYIVDFQAYLMKSKSESAVYDFKQGFYTLNPSKREFDEASFYKILCNISALANLGKERIGYLFIGVTDKEADTLQVEKIDGLINLPRFHDFGVVGLEREAKIKGVSLDHYISFITSKISNSGLDSTLKTRVTKDLTPITYHGQTILMVKVACGDEPVYFDEKLFQRDGANCVEVTGSKQKDIFKLF
ncbi:GmrSD restriction endonuclease domain-containing protein [Geofilum sp. OHC36d9]|uniref:GmrSD restriction endonuclease domain-containing protein n=1 Tax=Geofilum sp. OHC36d9 TaxID=3458413 RepID=UPI00403388E1